MIITDQVLVGLSGGVDSSVAVLLLREHGFEVVAASILFSQKHHVEIEAAKRLADELQLRHSIIDMRSRFEEHVLADFCNNYQDARTPNPCVRCNPSVKLYALTELANDLNIPKIATGHYADLLKYGNHTILACAPDLSKDQSYMLYRVPQEILSRLIFPLASYKKSDIRDKAKAHELSSADKADSQELCFCDDYVQFLNERGVTSKRGDFILPDGRRIRHRGSYCYTVGQRKGLSVSYAHPLYVKSIEPNGDIYLGDKSELYSHRVEACEVMINDYFSDLEHLILSAKVRSTAKPTECIIKRTSKEQFLVEFKEPVFAPARGQSIVLYTELDGRSVVVGGGIIK